MKNEEKPEPIEFPVRINKYLALRNFASRRGADKLIADGKVLLNGKVAVLGDKVGENDTVKVLETPDAKEEYVYLAYNKKKGIVTSTPQPGEKSIEDVIRFPTRVFPIGRLDKESHGLIILTNDGRITARLLDPEYEHEKEYVVQVNKEITQGFITKMGKGVQLEDFMTKKCFVEEVDERSFRIILTEGKRHQIRRMCTKFGYEVDDLKRIRVMNIRLGGLTEGAYKRITGKELSTFFKELGMDPAPKK